MCPVARRRRGLRRDLNGSALPRLPQSVPRGTRFSRLHWFAFATACQVARPPGVGEDRGADRGSDDADVSSIPPLIPYGGFSPVRLEGWPVRRGLPGSSEALAFSRHSTSCARFSLSP